ncbi:MAG: 50S ribosomal protein L13 [Candidatus Levybacteria bacterium RIFCSPHIGHO2_01_FULL_37_33]|nr:MAG: 50S ribosomal protein L13 [Candidatus Levybacteria bacterium RIFCSPHIGHO2_01_FULL_37_33]OGH15755.1 MAG: 50S ribosomal protein L13 [Candidatus Levybacteria bacterium RIFCSPHIGHO2_02_FULL_37_11]OGH29667.1 MAG: 50S ribosomal protein L13 [Candidatus Levybacteria bacterium RIFCSPHIGHO2_12_FULL_37_12]OGH32593.1 MAG: 50S ribosomal protein L13 [Candidatus Levybacteria bacterium RIFCSPLOWO2_01_FULL_36_54]
MKMTKATKASDIKRSWHLVEVNGEILGRISSEIAKLLMGKSKPYYVRNLDCGDYVVVINASSVKVTGKKETDKKYYRHSGYPGGLRVEALRELRESKPEEIIRHAVKGMLPQNKLRDRMLTRLFVYRDEIHPYTDKLNKS